MRELNLFTYKNKTLSGVDQWMVRENDALNTDVWESVLKNLHSLVSSGKVRHINVYLEEK